MLSASVPSEMTLIIFFIGFFSGLVTAMSALIYLLSASTVNDSSSITVTHPGEINVSPEDLPADENPKQLTAAVRNSTNLQSDIKSSSDELNVDIPSITMYQLEQTFYELSNSSKERGKELKTFAPFLSDIGRAYTSFSKDLAKLSLASRLKIKSNDKNAIAITSDACPDSDIVHDYYSEWWKALSLFLDHTSDDAARLAEIMSQELAPRIVNICEDLSTEDKKLMLDGSILLTQLKDSLMNNEPLLQERDKWRVKVSTALIVPTGIPIIGGMSLIQSEEESIRRVQKLQACELALLQNMNRISECKSVFRISMSNILKRYKDSSSLSSIQAMKQMINLGDVLKKFNNDSNRSIERFTSHIFASKLLGPGTVATGEASVFLKSKAMLQTAGPDQKNCPASNTIISPESVLNIPLESTTSFPASAPIVMSPLPPFFQNTAGLETCVWFNAFSSRIYRDAARSEYFHSWLQTTLTKSLNRGKKPGFIDEFKVEGLVFGSTPPALSNVKLILPTAESAVKKVFVSNCNQAYTNQESNSIKEYVDTKSNFGYHSCESSYGNDCISSSETSFTGLREDLNDGKEDLEAMNISDSKNTGSRNIITEKRENDKNNINNYKNSNDDKKQTHENCGEEKNGGASSISDEDVECSADLVYKSGIKFKVSTR